MCDPRQASQFVGSLPKYKTEYKKNNAVIYKQWSAAI